MHRQASFRQRLLPEINEFEEAEGSRHESTSGAVRGLHREQSKCNQDKKRTGTIIQWYAQAFVFSGGLTGLSIMPLPPSRKVFQDDLGKKKGRPS